MTKNDFAQQLQTIFRVEHEGGSRLDLTLGEVEDGVSTPAQEQFSLIFYGPADPNLGQGMFELEHQHLGKLPIFLVPIGIDQRGIRYQAVFNLPGKDKI